MAEEIHFATDLYRGTAGYYDRYRLPYPAALLDHLVTASRVSGGGRLLDLACGTGQLAFPLSPHFAEVWAVDQERDMVETVRAKADAAGIKGLRPIVSSAERLDAPPDSFELAVIGNAFHRLDPDLIARRMLGWLVPGGHLACRAPGSRGSGSGATGPGRCRRARRSRVRGRRPRRVHGRALLDAGRAHRPHPLDLVPPAS
ncbi:class I SAM-dependent methyltransferase [Catenulispora rubra]|uniref:class I SAM-dependent methyltransferase n=1 Tax=Catenulispora rubra TaxID=280293 RepID=UPI0018921E63|nr:class I SAM-dependent methyltransferase [Catenulispora rubra]